MGKVIPLPSKCVHSWTPVYDDDGNIIGKICTSCGTEAR